MKKSQLIVASLALGGAIVANAGTIAPSSTPTDNTINQAACSVISAESPITNYRPSKNVGLGYGCNTTAIAINAGNIKGKYTYGGGSTAGSVKQCSTTAVDTTNGYTVAAPSPIGDGCS